MALTSDMTLEEAVREQFALLDQREGSPLAQALDRACQLISDSERENDIAWGAFIETQRELEDAQEEIRRLKQQLVGTPINDEEGTCA